MNLKRLFTDHPASVGETYGRHLLVACGFGARMVAAGCACLLHGVFPWLFRTTGSDTIRALHERMVLHRTRESAQASGAARASVRSR
jgi:hypothetical protein